MEILIGCDVDPVLPAGIGKPLQEDQWSALGKIEDLRKAAGGSLPVMTWLIRADDSVRFATGDFSSGYLSKKALWEDLRRKGHELGWHMHLMSREAGSGVFRFDREPSWLGLAHGALSRHFPVRACRTGWGYGSNRLFRSLDALGLEVDFSAMPGNRMWFKLERDTVDVDWLRCLPGLYHPGADDYRRPGAGGLNILEVPIAQFPNSLIGMARRAVWRAGHGCLATSGMNNKTRLLTQNWPTPPKLESEILAFSFHPEGLTDDGIRSFMRNVQSLR